MTQDRSRLRHWRTALLPLVCIGMVLASLWCSQRLTFDSPTWPGVRLAQAESLPAAATDDEMPSGDLHWQATALPDNWKVTRPDSTGSVWYRVAFDPHGIDAPAALIPRLATSGQVFLNGSRLWDGRSSSPTAAHSWNAPLLVLLPPGLLRPEGNELQIQASGPPRYRAGLSAIQLAPYAALKPIYQWRLFWQHDGAMLSCAVSAITGLLLMLTWLRNRRDTMYLYFGLATLLWAARNSNLFLAELPISLDAWAVLVHAGHIWFNVLFALFVLRFTRTRWRWLEQAIWLYGILNSVLMWGGALTTIEIVLRWMVVPSLALYILLIGLLLRKGWRERSTETALIAATTLTFLVLSLRDAMLLDSRLPYEAYYISHYTGVLMLIAIAWTLVAQLANALGSIERLNVDLERRVQQRTRELELANAAKTRFLAAASHDMRQPVVAIGLLIGMLREQLLAAPLRGMVDRLHEAAASMEALLKGLMDLSRLESGTITPRLQPVPLGLLFDAIELHEQPAAAEKKLALRFRRSALAVMSDPVLLDQIVRNLVDNAVRYTERGGVLVAARLRRPGTVLLQVWDSGRGIAAESQSLVFEEFVQLDNPGRDRNKGLGLGLAIVQRSARLLGLRVGLRSVPGRGSCFTLELPVAPHAAPAVVPRAVPALPLSGIDIWLIEDDAAVRDAMVARLRSWGADVLALAGRAGLQQHLDGATPLPRLVVSDQRLPDGSGVDCVALVRRAAGRALPAVIVTGDTAPTDLARFASTGLPVLHKPFGADALLALLKQTLARDDATLAEASGLASLARSAPALGA
jgi:signal transduction histidine kinase/CheY-like chemotaxis protein